jgi:hypothetical protein
MVNGTTPSARDRREKLQRFLCPRPLALGTHGFDPGVCSASCSSSDVMVLGAEVIGIVDGEPLI